MHAFISPRTARQAKLLRIVQRLAKKNPAVPQSAAEQMLLVNSQCRKEEDVRLSQEEESLRAATLPVNITEHSVVPFGQTSKGNVYHFRDFPMYPGEYVPPETNTLASLKDELKLDLSAQSLKHAWMNVSGGEFFKSVEDYYSRADGLDEHHLAEIVSALFPSLDKAESNALISKVLEKLSQPASGPARQLSRKITAEAVGLDDAPGHYTNFMEWMGRITDTKAFKTEHALFQFCRRKFNRKDVRVMFENYNLMGNAYLKKAMSDGYSHIYEVLKDFCVKVNGEDTRHQLGVRIDPPEYDEETGLAFGYGKSDYAEVTAFVRENRDGKGRMFMMGKPLREVFADHAWTMERILQPFDEASLNFRDFDVYFLNEGRAAPFLGHERMASACQLAVATALSKLMPLTRIPLKKAGMLSFDRRKELGQNPGFLDGKSVGRFFRKR